MIIGFMRNFKTPNYMANLSAKLCEHHGLKLIYIRPQDVNIEKGTVQGKILIDNEWIKTEAPLPNFIDISIYCYKKKNRKIMNYLREKVFLSDNNTNRLGKEKLQKILKQDTNFAHLTIPSFKIRDSLGDLKKFLDKYSTIVMKPIRGERGKGIYILSHHGENYLVGHNKEEMTLSHDELEHFFSETIKNNNYIAQKYIQSRTLQGDPFDCRVHVEKNGAGKWEIAKKYIRIGIGQKVISNVNQGGGISEPKPFLKANFGDQWKEIDEKLNNLGKTLPYKIEDLRQTHIMSLGIDVGIDKTGELYVFESNSAPSTKALKAEVTMLRTDYYKYIVDNKVYMKS